MALPISGAAQEARDFCAVSSSITKEDLPTPLEIADAKANIKNPVYTPIVTQEAITALEGLRHITVTKYLIDISYVIQMFAGTLKNREVFTRIVDPASFLVGFDTAGCYEDMTDEQKMRATHRVDYLGIVPTIEGMPIWDRLPNERMDYYIAFKMYRDSKFTSLDSSDYLVTSRNIRSFSKDIAVPANFILYLSRMYSWEERLRAYDIWIDIQIEEQKHRNIAYMQNKHMHIAEDLCAKALNYLDMNIGALKPRDAIQMLELGMKFARASVGLDTPGRGSVPIGQKNVTINNNTQQNADNVINMNNPMEASASEREARGVAERRLDQDMKNTDNIKAVLQVLQASGAMNVALGAKVVEQLDEVESVDEFDDAIETSAVEEEFDEY